MNHNHILAVLADATDSQMAEGLAWYGDAHAIAAEAGDVRIGAGVIAALSPLMSWERNVELARDAFRNGHAAGALSRNVAKADAILDGADPLTVLGGDKVRSFYLNILDPFDTEPVTVDRHAYDIATGDRNAENDRPGIKGKRYRDLADLYRSAAAEAGIIPNQLQSITWTVWRERWAWRKTPA